MAHSGLGYFIFSATAGPLSVAGPLLPQPLDVPDCNVMLSCNFMSGILVNPVEATTTTTTRWRGGVLAFCIDLMYQRHADGHTHTTQVATSPASQAPIPVSPRYVMSRRLLACSSVAVIDRNQRPTRRFPIIESLPPSQKILPPADN